MKGKLLQVNPKDNCAVAIEDINANEKVILNDNEILVKEDIPFGFKVSIEEILKGNYVYKYGNPIGKASEDIGIGDMVHVHNIIGNLDH